MPTRKLQGVGLTSFLGETAVGSGELDARSRRSSEAFWVHLVNDEVAPAVTFPVGVLAILSPLFFLRAPLVLGLQIYPFFRDHSLFQ